MSEDAKSLAELKRYLEKRAEELENELRMIRVLIRLVDQSLSSQSFVRASELPAAPAAPQRPPEQPQPVTPPASEAEVDLSSASQVIPVTARTGELLARMYVFPDKIVIRMERPFHTTTSPFNAFFVRKVLEGFKRKSEDLVAQGALRPEEAFSYDIREEDGLLKEIIIRNYGGQEALREIRSTLRWTLNKMVQREG